MILPHTDIVRMCGQAKRDGKNHLINLRKPTRKIQGEAASHYKNFGLRRDLYMQAEQDSGNELWTDKVFFSICCLALVLA